MASTTHLKKGDKAPLFEGKDKDGKTISLVNYIGKKVILYFYPKDDTPGCTAEACNFRDNYQDLIKKGFEIIGVSVDDEKSHQKFTTKFNLPFPLIADTSKAIVEAYGVWGEKSMFGKKYMGTNRITFIIDEKGIIEQVFTKVETASHTEQILKAL